VGKACGVLRFDPTFARSSGFRGQHRTFERPGQRQITPGASKGRSKRALEGTETLTRADWPASRHTSPSVALRTSTSLLLMRAQAVPAAA
jgi:hypothetical protein